MGRKPSAPSPDDPRPAGSLAGFASPKIHRSHFNGFNAINLSVVYVAGGRKTGSSPIKWANGTGIEPGIWIQGDGPDDFGSSDGRGNLILFPLGPRFPATGSTTRRSSRPAAR